ncbi:hypothetical protein DYB25_011134, partial [Aphanomyces astaci]
MDVLAQIFPDIPEGILAEVLHNCGGSVEAASDWLCEHDWHELVPDNDDDETNQQEDGEGLQHGDTSYTNANLLTISTPVALEAPPAAAAMPPLGPFDNPSDDEGDEDDEDEDDEDDEDDDNMYYDSGDDGDGGRLGGGPRVPPLTSRTKVSPSSDVAGISSSGNEPRFWVAFDDVTMQKSMIDFDELMNIAAHGGRRHPPSMMRRQHLDGVADLTCGLATPCTAADMLRVGTNLHGVLSLATGSSLYFRAAASIPPPFVASGMGLMEVSFRAGATHRIRRLEVPH